MAERKPDEYQALGFYKKHTETKEAGFSKFDVDGIYYFCRYSDGKICFLSQAYKGKAGRDNGIASVKTNQKIEHRYRFETRENGKYGFSLRAGNGQEIAISPDYSSQKTAEHVAGRLTGKRKAAAKPKAKPKSASQVKPAQEKAPAKKPSRPKKTSKSVAKTAAVTGLAAGGAAAATKAGKARNVEQDYKPLAFYQRHTTGRQTGIESFLGEDEKHYFAYFENGEIALISEAYPTAAARNAGVASVEKNIGLEERYIYRGPLKNGKYEYRLKAGNHKEIARSVWYGSAAAATAGAAYLMGRRTRVAPLSPKPSAPLAAVAGAPLTAAAIKTPKAKPAVAAPIVAAAAVGTAAVTGAAASTSTPVKAPPVATADAAPVMEGGGGIWGWLKWLLLLLLMLLALIFLFRSCSGGDAKTVAPAPAAVETVTAAPLVRCWNGSEAETLAACPAKITCWNGDEVTSQSACPIEPVAEPAPMPEPAPAPIVTPEPVIAEPVAPVRAAQISTPVRASGVAGATAGIFSAGVTPVSIGRLGTNPEFGDSRGLSASAFYDKLNAQYATNTSDRAYLNYLAKELGYGGWTDVSAADFTDSSVAYGTVGVLGYGRDHGYQYSKLDLVNRADLAAFQMASRNGRTVYFMKRCGNYFFPT